MNMEYSIGFIGGGRIAQIFLTGWQRAGRIPAQVVVSDTNAEVLALRQRQFPSIVTTLANNRMPAGADIVFLALHPPAIGPTLAEIRDVLRPEAILISLAPKWTLVRLSDGLGGFSRLARVIPNAPSLVGKGYNPVAFSADLPQEDREEILTLLRPFGQAPITEEWKLEAYAILTGMGPTYFWFQFFALRDLICQFGLPEPEVTTALRAMLEGAMDTITASGLAPEQVMDLIPVKPLGEEEERITALYHQKLEPLYQKIKP